MERGPVGVALVISKRELDGWSIRCKHFTKAPFYLKKWLIDYLRRLVLGYENLLKEIEWTFVAMLNKHFCFSLH